MSGIEYPAQAPPTVGTSPRWQPGHRPLTFGVEIEFNLAEVKSERDPSPENPSPAYLAPFEGYGRSSFRVVTHKLAQKLLDVNIPAYSLEDKHLSEAFEDFESGNESKDCSESPFDAKYWVVKMDNSIFAPDRRYNYHGIELNTPIFYFNEQNLEEISHVVDTLKQEARLSTNDTCGLHVHVGNTDEPFNLHTLRNFAAFIWCFEEQLNQIHPRHRTDGDHADMYCPGVSSCRLAKSMENRGFKGLEAKKKGLDVIFECDDRERVIDWMSHGEGGIGSLHRCAYHMKLQATQMWVGPVALKRTIEFRAHEGTLNGVRIGHWVKVCEGLIRYARDTRAADVESFCRRNLGRPVDGEADLGCSLFKVLTKIGCMEQAEYYSERKRSGKVESESNPPIQSIQWNIPQEGEPVSYSWSDRFF